jgi:hypothetical protein
VVEAVEADPVVKVEAAPTAVLLVTLARRLVAHPSKRRYRLVV